MSNTGVGATKLAPINISTATTTAISGAGAVAGLSYVVDVLQLSIEGASTTAVIQSTGGTALTGVYTLPAGGGILNINMTSDRQNPLLASLHGEGLQIVTTGGAVNVRGFISFHTTQQG